MVDFVDGFLDSIDRENGKQKREYQQERVWKWAPAQWPSGPQKPCNSYTPISQSKEDAVIWIVPCRIGKKRQKCREALSIRRFRAHYDIGPGAVEQLASDLKKYYDEPINLPNLFMALHWLKLYSTEEVMAGRWGHGEQYCRETTKKYVKQIRSMK